ncbi:MAG: hypothetical protein JWN94_3841 [Betaproteobacteria bacterium]|nr:hypothetical protein [Betaproteobacteria bacterium]
MKTMKIKPASVSGVLLVSLLASGFLISAAIADPIAKKPGAGRVVVNPSSTAKPETSHNQRAEMMAEVQKRATRRSSSGRRHGQRH